MPTYDYECTGCGNTLEVFQRMSEAPRKKCPRCGKNKLQRLIGAGAGFLFKGSGFYITDYRSSDYKARAKAETDSSGGAAAKPATGAKSESSAPATPPPKPRAEPKAEPRPGPKAGE
jgi:putative FmdB family regulatory protein